MIYTITLNPSIDYIVGVNQFEVGKLNRTTFETKYPGGKGINVSRVLSRLGVQARALGFLGGFTGAYIETFLRNEGIEADFIKVEEDTRINVKLKTDTETEINGQGPAITGDQLSALVKQVKQLTSTDILVLAGSLPSSLPATLYRQLIEMCSEKGCKVVVDTSGTMLMDVLPYQPFLVKPNHHELGELFGVEITSKEEAVVYGKKLLELGAQNVIVSMGGAGALFLNNDITLFAEVPKGEVKNSVGAGDSVVAGFIGSIAVGEEVSTAFLTGVSAGTATAFLSDLCTVEDVEKMKENVKIHVL